MQYSNWRVCTLHCHYCNDTSDSLPPVQTEWQETKMRPCTFSSGKEVDVQVKYKSLPSSIFAFLDWFPLNLMFRSCREASILIGGNAMNSVALGTPQPVLRAPPAPVSGVNRFFLKTCKNMKTSLICDTELWRGWVLHYAAPISQVEVFRISAYLMS